MRGTMIVFHPDKPEPDLREFDRPLTLDELRDAVGGYFEPVPRFKTIAYGGTVLDCIAFCNENGKEDHLPINDRATIIWNMALRRVGQELYDPSGIPKDWLVGNVAVVFGDREFMREL
jgi:hypothetical protein